MKEEEEDVKEEEEEEEVITNERDKGKAHDEGNRRKSGRMRGKSIVMEERMPLLTRREGEGEEGDGRKKSEE